MKASENIRLALEAIDDCKAALEPIKRHYEFCGRNLAPIDETTSGITTSIEKLALAVEQIAQAVDSINARTTLQP